LRERARLVASNQREANEAMRRTPGRAFVDQARAALSAPDIARATKTGARLKHNEVLA
jgi:hypothetical protein